jgi:hypothetical protein
VTTLCFLVQRRRPHALADLLTDLLQILR